MVYVFDIEADNLLDEVTRIHCLSFKCIDELPLDHAIAGTLTTKEDIIKFFNIPNATYVGHNIIRYDFPVLKKIYNINTPKNIIDTLSLSWYLYPDRNKHGLEYWGETFSISKPIIKDWNNLSIEEYCNRCRVDVQINTMLYNNILQYLKDLYQEEDYNRIIGYLNFKLDCLKEQEENPLYINKDLCLKTAAILKEEKFNKLNELFNILPKIPVYKTVTKPAKMLKANGELSVAGEKWNKIVKEHNLAENDTTITFIEDYEEPNPQSSQQIKDWLFSLGWKPTIFEFRLNTKKEENKVPQITNKEGILCPNLKILAETYPEILALEGIGIIKHRLSILEGSEKKPGGFIHRLSKNNTLKAEANGLTNTLRFKHLAPIVNLPSVFKPYGKEIRGSIIAPEGKLVCGNDMSSLEDNTKQHFMYFFDPEYVTQMRIPGFDPHLDIALLAGMLNEEQIEEHKLYDKTKGSEGVSHKNVRNKSKQVNFSCVYGAGPPKIAKSSGMSLEEATLLHTIYWKRNKAVKQVADAVKTKTINGQMWLYNPISNFWYSLRFEKDKFSTLNQGSGVYCFDSYVKKVREKGIKISMQYHDEILFYLNENEVENISQKLDKSIEETNEELKLNIQLGISKDFGNSYSDCH